MNLLLLLSALLSALCDGGDVRRTMRATQTISSAISAADETRTVARAALERPVQALPSIVKVLARPGVAFAALVAEPLFAPRRRE